MGGSGSGNRWRTAGRPCTNEFRSLDVRWLGRQGLLRPTGWLTLSWKAGSETTASIRIRGGRDQVHLRYRHQPCGGAWKEESYAIRVVYTPCHFGGDRAWFLCPAVGCGRRVAVLFGGGVFACRHCYRLVYPSTREDGWDRAIRRADTIRDRLGWQPGILNGMGPKPKWMRWRTFDRLLEEHDTLVQGWVGEVRKRFGGATR